VVAAERWMSYVNTLPWERGHLDDSTWNAFLRGGSLGIPPEDAVREAAQRIERAGDHPLMGKIQRQVRRAYSYAGAHAGEVWVPPPPKPQYEPSQLTRIAKRIDFEVTPEWLASISPVTVWNRTPARFLHLLYRAGDRIVVFNVFESQGVCIWTHPGLTGNFAALNWLQQGQEFGVWYLANPVDGKYHWNEREQSRSRRSQESIISWRYLVLESDNAPADLWLRAVVQLPLPVAAIYLSGGKSVHVLIRIDAASKEDWDRQCDDIKPLLVKLGACPGSLTAVRLSRLPNCMREEKGALQRLLYLNPNPDLTPICKMEVRR
jgi:hypothetical protein